jgi:hypothetical protein
LITIAVTLQAEQAAMVHLADGINR